MSTTQRPPAQQQSLLASIVLLPFQGFGVLCGMLLLCIVIECVGMHFFWPEQNWQHAQQRLNVELVQFTEYFPRSLLVQNPPQVARRLIETSQRWLLKRELLNTLHDATAQIRDGHYGQENFHEAMGLLSVHLENYLMASAYTMLIFAVRLLALCLTLPLFVVSAFIGCVDGLVRRDIRRFGAGRESGFLHHRARASVMPAAVWPCVVYLVLPVAVPTWWILLPSAVLLVITVDIAAGSFKKYV